MLHRVARVLLGSVFYPFSLVLCLDIGTTIAQPFSNVGTTRQVATPPAFFVENRGQTDDDVRYYLQGAGTVFFTKRGLLFERADSSDGRSMGPLAEVRLSPPAASFPRFAYELEFVNANAVLPQGREPLRGRVNYLIGKDPSTWRSDVPTFRQVVYTALYGGSAADATGSSPRDGAIDAVWQADAGRLKYEFVVHPGADPRNIKLAYTGVEDLRVDASGNLVVHTAFGEVMDSRPLAYQEIAGEKVPVTVAFDVASPGGRDGPKRFVYGFKVKGYDSRHPLIIDPGLEYSTFLGGTSPYGDAAMDIAVDAAGDIYVTGQTSSVDFPVTPGAFDTSYEAASPSFFRDVFVTKLDATGAELVYSTYLGGVGSDYAEGIAVDAAGNAYVTGNTEAADFPTTQGAYDDTFDSGVGNPVVFVTKLDASGSALVYSTFLGGAGEISAYGSIGSTGRDIAVDDGGHAYVTGSTSDAEFPTTLGAYDTEYNGHVRYAGDVFVTKLEPDGSALVYSTFIGGSWDEAGEGIAIDTSGSAYIAGWTHSEAFPVTAGAFDTSFEPTGRIDTGDAFVAKLLPDGSGLVWSTFLGGPSNEEAAAIAVNAAGEAHVVGYTASGLFPVTAGALAETYNGTWDAFVAKLSPNGSSLAYSTFLGGTDSDDAFGVALDEAGTIFVAGQTYSSDFPTTPGAPQPNKNLYGDAYVVGLSPLGLGAGDLVYGTFLGGSEGGGDDRAENLAVDASGAVYVTGSTYSPDFPVTAGAYDETCDGLCGFISKIVPTGPTVGEQCNNDSDDDGDALTDCNDPECCMEDACLGTPACPVLVEDLAAQEATLEGTVSGTLSGTLAFASLETVTITSGPFAGQGFARGEWEATLDGTLYRGTWRGAVHRKPGDTTIVLEGATTGDVTGVLLASLVESEAGSGDFDWYTGTWSLVRVGGVGAAAVLELEGTVSYGENTSFADVALGYVQSEIAADVSGDYQGALATVTTGLAVAAADNPYFGEGFLTLSYVAGTGSGVGRLHVRRASPGSWDASGFLADPLLGVATGLVDETAAARKMTLKLERAGLPPLADIELRVVGPRFVSPGVTVDYAIEYRNDGSLTAADVVVVAQLPDAAQWVSATGGGVYRWDTHEAIWKLGSVAPGGRGLVSVKVYYFWELPEGLPETLLAMYESATAERDYYLNPEREPLFDHAAYLAYAPLEITSSQAMNVTEFAVERASDPVLDDLYGHAVESGYEFRAAEKTTLVGGTVVTTALMVNGVREAAFINRGPDSAVLVRHLETGLSLSDSDGGMTFDARTGELEQWGTWAVAGSPTPAQCVRNCIVLKLPNNVIQQLSKKIGLLFKGWDCIKCFTSREQDKCVKCISIAKDLPLIGEYLDVQECRTCCSRDPNCYLCKEDKRECSSWSPSLGHYSAIHVWRCNKETGEYWPYAEETNCGSTPTSCCIDGQPTFGVCGRVPRICRDGRCADPQQANVCGKHSFCEPRSSEICPAKDPNAKHGPAGAIAAGQRLDYDVEFENIGQGVAYGVYMTDTLDEDLDDSSLEIGPVLSVEDGSEIAPAGEYDPSTRTVTWLVGEVAAGAGGHAALSISVRADAPLGTEIINWATVYFPSVPEITPTNPVVSWIPLEDCANGEDDDGDGLVDCDSPSCDGACSETDRCHDGRDNDADGHTDCDDTDCLACPQMCGNGLVDNGEDCDDGDNEFASGDYCSGGCAAVPCGIPTNPRGTAPTASDALFTLKTAVGQVTCDLRVCDVNASASVTAADALTILKKAVGHDVPLACAR